jgi:hypothetical protein
MIRERSVLPTRPDVFLFENESIFHKMGHGGSPDYLRTLHGVPEKKKVNSYPLGLRIVRHTKVRVIMMVEKKEGSNVVGFHLRVDSRLDRL